MTWLAYIKALEKYYSCSTNSLYFIMNDSQRSILLSMVARDDGLEKDVRLDAILLLLDGEIKSMISYLIAHKGNADTREQM